MVAHPPHQMVFAHLWCLLLQLFDFGFGSGKSRTCIVERNSIWMREASGLAGLLEILLLDLCNLVLLFVFEIFD